jgi:toxin-antitoxin system PIN domain toxin
MPALLDTNVLLALAWPNHQHHAAAHRWFQRNSRDGWHTCALTQIAFVRLSSNPSYTPAAVTPMNAARLLAAFMEHPSHRLLEQLPAIAPEMFERALGHQQANDAYLVRLAEHGKITLATFDRRASVHATRPGVVVVIPAIE